VVGAGVFAVLGVGVAAALDGVADFAACVAAPDDLPELAPASADVVTAGVAWGVTGGG